MKEKLKSAVSAAKSGASRTKERVSQTYARTKQGVSDLSGRAVLSLALATLTLPASCIASRAKESINKMYERTPILKEYDATLEEIDRLEGLITYRERHGFEKDSQAIDRYDNLNSKLGVLESDTSLSEARDNVDYYSAGHNSMVWLTMAGLVAAGIGARRYLRRYEKSSSPKTSEEST